ncbi:uncharacterized protein LOC143029223 [Oratosquilla oratoria]|uniref:uncharacterized protein LOC143029223 n=1 Tax=Oratosquilla oratoria TaxID=337810 RepID=UPI003F769A83
MMREEDLDIDALLTPGGGPAAPPPTSGFPGASEQLAHLSPPPPRLTNPKGNLPVTGVGRLGGAPEGSFPKGLGGLPSASVFPGSNSEGVGNPGTLPGTPHPHMADPKLHYIPQSGGATQGILQPLRIILEENVQPPNPPALASFDNGGTVLHGGAPLPEDYSFLAFPKAIQPTGRHPSIHHENPPSTQPIIFNPVPSTHPVYTYPVNLTPSFRANPTPTFPITLTPAHSSPSVLPLPQPSLLSFSLPTNLNTLTSGGEPSYSNVHRPISNTSASVTPLLPTPYQPTLTPSCHSPRARPRVPRATPLKTPVEALRFISGSPSALSSSPPLVPSQLSYPPPPQLPSHRILKQSLSPGFVYNVPSQEPPPPYAYEESPRVPQWYLDENTPLLGRSCHSHVDSYGGVYCSDAPGKNPGGREQSVCTPCGKRRFSRHQVLALVSMLIMDFASFAAMSILAPFFPQLIEERGLSRTVDGVIFSVYAGVVTVASPILGRILPKCSPFSIYIGGIFTTACSNICFGLIPSIEATEFLVVAAITLRALTALGAAAFLTVIYTVVPALFPDDISTVNGMLETSIGVGMSVGPSLGSWLFTVGGFGLPFYALGGFLLMLLPLNCFMFPNTDDCKSSENGKYEVSLMTVLRDPVFVLILVILAATAMCNGMLYPTLQPHMDELGVSIQRVGLVYLLLSVVYAVAAPLVGLATDKFNCPYAFLLVGLFGIAVSLLLLGNSPILPNISSELLVRQDVAAIVVLAISSGLSIVPTYAAMLDIAVSYTDNPTAHISFATYSLVGGLWSSSYSLGEMVGPLYAGFLFDYYTLDVITSFTALLPIALCFVLAVTMCFMNNQEPSSCARGETQ